MYLRLKDALTDLERQLKERSSPHAPPRPIMPQSIKSSALMPLQPFGPEICLAPSESALALASVHLALTFNHHVLCLAQFLYAALHAPTVCTLDALPPSPLAPLYAAS